MRLDRASRAALEILTLDGTSIADAIRAALTAAGEARASEYAPAETAPAIRSKRRWLAEQTSFAPPLTAYQRYVLTAAFINRDEHWLSEAQWRLEKDDRGDVSGEDRPHGQD